jgi:hypothetical protein
MAKPKNQPSKQHPNTDNEYAVLPDDLARKCQEAARTGNLADCSKHYKALEGEGAKAKKSGLQLPRDIDTWPRWMNSQYIKGYNAAPTSKN